MALSPVGNYTGHLTNQPAYQVTGAKKIAGLGVGKSHLAWLPSFPSDWTLTGVGQPFWTWHPGCWASLPGVQGTPFLPPGSPLIFLWGTGSLRPALETT